MFKSILVKSSRISVDPQSIFDGRQMQRVEEQALFEHHLPHYNKERIAMGFLKMLAGGVSRDVQIKNLRAKFARQYPGESTQGTFEGYCGIGMKVAESINAGNESERLHFINIVDGGIASEREHHRPFVNEAYEIGLNSILKK
jgi:hypothetical protein